MKKALLILTISIIPGIMNAQHKFGISAGASGSTLSEMEENPLGLSFDPEALKFDVKISYTAGLFYTYDFSDKFFIISTLDYYERGAKSNIGSPLYKMYGIGLSVLPSYRLGEKTYLQLGPEVSRTLNNKKVIYQPFDDIDYGAKAGIGYDILEKLSVNLTYYHGFPALSSMSLRKTLIDPPVKFTFAKSRALSLTLRYQLI